MKFIVMHEGELSDSCETLAEAKKAVAADIRACYSVGDTYEIYEHVCTGSSNVKVNFKKGADDE